MFSVSVLISIPFTFFSLSMMCQNLLVFVCFCILAFPEVSALGRWLICRKFPTYLFCELWPLPLKSFLLVLFVFPEFYLTRYTITILLSFSLLLPLVNSLFFSFLHCLVKFYLMYTANSWFCFVSQV